MRTGDGEESKCKFDAALRHLRVAEEALGRSMEACGAALLEPGSQRDAQLLMWRLRRLHGQGTEYVAEALQDRFLDEFVFHGKRGGVFVDVGAYDGVTGSNTVLLEKYRGWTGLCIEPDAERFGELVNARSVACMQTCIAAQDGKAEFLCVRRGFTQMGGLVETLGAAAEEYLSGTCLTDKIAVPTRQLGGVLAEHGLVDIDYLSVDVEGAELAVLGALDFERFHITAISVERNGNEAALGELLRKAGFARVRQLGGDDIFVQTRYLASYAADLLAEMTGEAVALHEGGRYAEAETLYRDVLAADGSNPGIHYNLGISLLCRGERQEAMRAFARAVEIWPDFELASGMIKKEAVFS
jgi:FkbM family methyltransferase